MIYISHRGNIKGKSREHENTFAYINDALALDYYVEVDVWYTNRNLYLGHDRPDLAVQIEYLQNPKIICHAKNREAIKHLQENNTHWFWHQTDDYTLTSKGWIWAYPGKQPVGNNCIAVMPENMTSEIRGFAGICSDIIGTYRND